MHREQVPSFSARKGPEARIGSDGIERLYGQKGVLDPSSYQAHMLKQFNDDPSLDVAQNDSQIIEAYLERQAPSYQEELARFASDIPELLQDIRLSIAIPAYKEERNIYHTLSQYAKLAGRESFEIVVLENHPEGAARDGTSEEIERFCKDYPAIRIVPMYKTFQEKRIGNIRKFLTDVILERKRRSGREDSLIIASNDADLEDINPRYAEMLIDAFENDPRLDALNGGTDHSVEAYRKFPLMHATVRFINYFEATQRRIDGEVRLNGRNSAFRSGLLAAIGGYNERAEIAEDLEIGWIASYARRGEHGRMKHVHGAWIQSNPRREIESALTGSPIVRRYDGFVSNERIYDEPLESLMRQGLDFSPEQFKSELQAIYDHYKERTKESGGWMPDATFTQSFDRAMRFSGLSYHIQEGRIVIDDMSKLSRGLESYADDTKLAA